MSYKQRKIYEKLHNITVDPNHDINPNRVYGRAILADSVLTLSLPGFAFYSIYVYFNGIIVVSCYNTFNISIINIAV